MQVRILGKSGGKYTLCIQISIEEQSTNLQYCFCICEVRRLYELLFMIKEKTELNTVADLTAICHNFKTWSPKQLYN
jgi:hypothetical protein